MIQDDLWSIIDPLTDLTLIMANENGQKPPKPYVTLQVTLGNPTPVHKGDVDDEGNRQLYIQYPATVQLQVIGGDNWNLAQTLALALRTDNAIELAEAKNIGYTSQTRISDVPMLVDNATYEPRAILEIDASYTTSVTENVGYIETVNGEMSTDPASPLDPQPFIATVAVTQEP